MKTLILLALMVGCACAYGATSTTHDALPPHKPAKSLKVKTKTSDHFQQNKKGKRKQGYNYYKYSNRPAYLRSMARSMNKG